MIKESIINDIIHHLCTCGFINNDFLLKYVNLIYDNLSTVKVRGLTQSHHILPVSYFKHSGLQVDNSLNNRVNLSYKDHILAHYYLFMCSSNYKDRRSNSFAVIQMMARLKINKDNIHNFFQIEDLIRDINIIIETNHYYNKTRKRVVSDATREKLRKNMMGENNPMYGHKRPDTALFNKLTKKGNKNNLNHRHSYESRLKISEKNKGRCKDYIWVNNGNEELFVSKQEAKAFLESNYVKGRLKTSVMGGHKNKGRLCGEKNPSKKEAVRQKISELQRNRRAYNNGVENRWFSIGDDIPDGFVPGWMSRR